LGYPCRQKYFSVKNGQVTPYFGTSIVTGSKSDLNVIQLLCSSWLHDVRKILINEDYIYLQVNNDANDFQEKDGYQNR
jgi:hypothetical protein